MLVGESPATSPAVPPSACPSLPGCLAGPAVSGAHDPVLCGLSAAAPARRVRQICEYRPPTLPTSILGDEPRRDKFAPCFGPWLLCHGDVVEAAATGRGGGGGGQAAHHRVHTYLPSQVIYPLHPRQAQDTGELGRPAGAQDSPGAGHASPQRPEVTHENIVICRNAMKLWPVFAASVGRAGICGDLVPSCIKNNKQVCLPPASPPSPYSSLPPLPSPLPSFPSFLLTPSPNHHLSVPSSPLLLRLFLPSPPPPLSPPLLIVSSLTAGRALHQHARRRDIFTATSSLSGG
ncbi:hypothetical protein E2C01_063535 [Portunus trituberculatus]|uniref:Uncharacterized protein n=1 Tax=Portunus trituberculatus TaxID=210409 RepID=A0A5B7HGM0_PORTR|nr:hypothetical protein [Portunus trituberculatus]